MSEQEEVDEPLEVIMSGLTAREKSLCFMDTENLPDNGQLEEIPPVKKVCLYALFPF